MSSKVSERIKVVEFENIDDLSQDDLQLYHTHLYCHRGSIRFLFNDVELECIGGQFLFWFAGSRLSAILLSKNFKATVLMVEKDFLLDNVPDQGWSINAQLHSRVHPVKVIHHQQDRIRIVNNFKTLNERYSESTHRFYEEGIKLQMQLFILDMWHLFANEYEQRKHSLQTGTLYQRFIKLLEDHCMQNREVSFYSDKLNISAKYLNHLSKLHSGMTASEWIQRHVRERLIILLQNKNLNISEIANQMHFSSKSFFSSYVKKLLGVSPTDYRARLN
jgi:AraC family transcriptional activator of pobA